MDTRERTRALHCQPRPCGSDEPGSRARSFPGRRWGFPPSCPTSCFLKKTHRRGSENLIKMPPGFPDVLGSLQHLPLSTKAAVPVLPAQPKKRPSTLPHTLLGLGASPAVAELRASEGPPRPSGEAQLPPEAGGAAPTDLDGCGPTPEGSGRSQHGAPRASAQPTHQPEAWGAGDLRQRSWESRAPRPLSQHMAPLGS